MFSILLCGLFFAVGGLVFAFAERLTLFEKRRLESHPWTKVTGWAGTPKGILSWRIVGIIIMLLSTVLLAEELFRDNVLR